MKRSIFIGATAAAALVPNVARAQIVGPYLQQLTIGVSVPLSGSYAAFGKDVVRGVQAAVDESNRFTPSIRYTWAVRSFDDQNSGPLAITNAQIAQSDATIVGMVGNLTADATIAALPAYANATFALVVPTVTDDSLTARNYRNVFRLPTKNITEGQLIAQSLLPKRTQATAVAVTTNGTYGPDVATGFVQQAKSDKHDASLVTLDATTHIDPALSAQAILAKTPTHVCLCGRPGDLGPVAQALQLAGYAGAFSLSDGFYAQATIDTYAKTFAGVSVASSLPPINRIPTFYQVYNDFQNAVGSITAFSAYGYAAAQLIILASQRTSATSRLSVLSTLQTGGTYDLLVGQYTFNFNGDAVLPNIYFYTVGKSGFTYSKPAVQTGFVM